jgi:hypothetical protein
MGLGDLLAMPLAAVGVALLVSPDLGDADPAYLVPGLGPLLIARDAVQGAVEAVPVVLACLGTVAACAVLVVLAGRLLSSERNVRRL